MNKFFRTLFVFVILLTSRQVTAQPASMVVYPVNKTPYGLSYRNESAVDKLNGIADFQAYPPKQTSDNLDELIQLAHLAQQELATILDNISIQQNIEATLPAPKSPQRAAQKVMNKFDGDASRITDLARGSLVADNVADLMASYQKLTETTEIIQVKNRFANPKASGYRDLNVLVKLPQSQMIVEVQLHLHSIAEIKSGVDHANYEQIQQIEATAYAARRPLNDIEMQQITRIRQQSHKQYHKAWLAYKRQAITASFHQAA
ncbi:RelA/SpoT domain-containing protein [Shewanella gaetbuli]